VDGTPLADAGEFNRLSAGECAGSMSFAPPRGGVGFFADAAEAELPPVGSFDRGFGVDSAAEEEEGGASNASKLLLSPPPLRRDWLRASGRPEEATVVDRPRAGGSASNSPADPAAAADAAAAAAAARGDTGAATEADEARPVGMREDIDAVVGAPDDDGDAGEAGVTCSATPCRCRIAVPGAAGLSTRACMRVAAARRAAAGVGGTLLFEPRGFFAEAVAGDAAGVAAAADAGAGAEEAETDAAAAARSAGVTAGAPWSCEP